MIWHGECLIYWQRASCRFPNFKRGVSHVKKIIPILLFGLVAVTSPLTYATPISTTIELGTVFTGTSPSGSAPWLTATFTSNTGAHTGTLVLTSHLNGSDFVGGPNIGWGFFLNTGTSSITCTGGNCADNTFSGGSYNAGPLGKNWNLAFEWLAGDRFVSGNTAAYDITFNSGLTGSPFIANPDPKAESWRSVAHVQNIGKSGASGWITGTDAPTNVPEPSVLGMFGLGTLLIGLFVGLRRRSRSEATNSSSF